jgi:hypothetical protein
MSAGFFVAAAVYLVAGLLVIIFMGAGSDDA